MSYGHNFCLPFFYTQTSLIPIRYNLYSHKPIESEIKALLLLLKLLFSDKDYIELT